MTMFCMKNIKKIFLENKLSNSGDEELVLNCVKNTLENYIISAHTIICRVLVCPIKAKRINS